MDRAVVDHRGPELPEVTLEVVANLRRVFGTEGGRIALWAGSGTGAWEAAVVNTLNPGETVLAFNTVCLVLDDLRLLRLAHRRARAAVLMFGSATRAVATRRSGR